MSTPRQFQPKLPLATTCLLQSTINNLQSTIEILCFAQNDKKN
jgi:hypothetical protein